MLLKPDAFSSPSVCRKVRPLVLVFPPQQWLLEGFASGLVALYSYVRRRLPDTVIRLVDLSHVPAANIQAKLREAFAGLDAPPIVGITTTTASYQSALEVARACRRACSDATVVLGGHHTRSQDGLILERHVGLIDYVVPGEGEVTLAALMQHYPDVSRVPGLSHIAPGGDVIRNPAAPPLEEPELDRIEIDLPELNIHATPGKFGHVTYVSARGCPLKCAFCAVANDRIRAKSIPCIINDLRHLVRDHGYSSIAIEDNFFAHAPTRTMALCEAIEHLQKEEHLHFTWDCQTRVESMGRPDIVASMARAGCEAVYLGVEALDPASLSYLNKTPNPVRYLHLLEDQVVPQLMRSPIDCYINVQLAIPVLGASTEKERRRQMEHTRRERRARLTRLGKIARGHGKMITVFPQLHVVYPGTAHFFQGVQAGRFPADVFESFTEWEYAEMPIRRFLAKEFAHGTGGIPAGIMVPATLQQGRGYDVDTNAVLEVLEDLREIEQIDGLQVFHYGQYIVLEETASVEPAETEREPLLRSA